MQPEIVTPARVLASRTVARRFTITTGATAALLSLQACRDCVSIEVFGIRVTVTDAVTKAAPSSAPSLRVTDGSYVHEVPRQAFDKNPPELYAADVRPGMYTVLVRAEGYQDFVKDGVRVSRSGGQCDYLKPVRINAELIRKP